MAEIPASFSRLDQPWPCLSDSQRRGSFISGVIRSTARAPRASSLFVCHWSQRARRSFQIFFGRNDPL